ncbi:MAG: methionine gamma-lyase family protein, partial [Oscillospiraceae bacterium]|nr:methionine gamma-lyase family protein [Oscillospiraceae bacterium]
MVNKFFNFDQKIITLSKQAEEKCKDVFARIDEIREYNEAKVLKAFSDNGVSEAHLGSTTGYGYDDLGRDT